MLTKVITDYLEQTSRRLPDKVAYVDGEQQYTFAETRSGARQLAMPLLRRGLFQRPVAIYMDNSAACILAMLGVAYSGNFYTVIDTQMPDSRVQKILDTLEPVVVLTSEKYSETVRRFSVQAEVLLYEEARREIVREEALEAVRQRLVSTDILYVLFTSGSTGTPKGVVTPHRAVMEYIEAVTEVYDLTEQERFGNQVPLHFVMSIVEVFGTLRNGSEMHLIPASYFTMPLKLVRYIEEQKINMLYWVPSAMVLIANLQAFSAADLSCVRKVAFGGEVMPVRQLNIWRKELPECVFYNAYGATEVPEGTSYYRIEHDLEETETYPIGKPFPHIGVLILRDDGEEAARGETGELCVYGPSLSYGYYGSPEQTGAVFTRNPLQKKYDERIYHTGDLVYENADGDMVYVGRKDHQIKLHGHRIELGEIEANISSLPEIEEGCCVFDTKKQRIVLFYTGAIEDRELQQKLTAMLPGYMLPNRRIRLEEMPHNLHGKLDREALKQRIEADRREGKWRL